jgi:hypothetical protein
LVEGLLYDLSDVVFFKVVSNPEQNSSQFTLGELIAFRYQSSHRARDLFPLTPSASRMTPSIDDDFLQQIKALDKVGEKRI